MENFELIKERYEELEKLAKENYKILKTLVGEFNPTTMVQFVYEENEKIVIKVETLSENEVKLYSSEFMADVYLNNIEKYISFNRFKVVSDSHSRDLSLRNYSKRGEIYPFSIGYAGFVYERDSNNAFNVYIQKILNLYEEKKLKKI